MRASFLGIACEGCVGVESGGMLARAYCDKAS